ncbi:MAG: ABC transporter substrate-binding protein [Dictyoglomus sp. NZ13-RE01]|nr:MAG: ABC transporter substrate-binding protein [Dictyoglomus sp. NZ13-RE01]
MKRSLRILSIIVLLLLCISFSKTNFPIEVKDDLGRVIKFSQIPKRIVSLAPSSTEILFALGLDKEIVGVTDFCDYPKQAQTKEKVGGFSNPNVEKIVKLNPDLVVLYKSFPKEIFNQLTQLLPNTNFIVLDPKNFEDVLNNILLLGKITGKETSALKIHGNMLRRLKEIERKLTFIKPSKKVLFLLWNDPFISASPSTFIGDLFKKLKVINIVENETPEYPILSIEYIVNKNPDYIIIGEMSGINIDSIINKPEFSSISAVKNRKVYYVNDDLVFRPGPRLIDGLEALFRIFYPNL